MAVQEGPFMRIRSAGQAWIFKRCTMVTQTGSYPTFECDSTNESVSQNGRTYSTKYGENYYWIVRANEGASKINYFGDCSTFDTVFQFAYLYETPHFSGGVSRDPRSGTSAIDELTIGGNEIECQFFDSVIPKESAAILKSPTYLISAKFETACGRFYDSYEIYTFAELVGHEFDFDGKRFVVAGGRRDFNNDVDILAFEKGTA